MFGALEISNVQIAAPEETKCEIDEASISLIIYYAKDMAGTM